MWFHSFYDIPKVTQKLVYIYPSIYNQEIWRMNEDTLLADINAYAEFDWMPKAI
jgi:hypothetical protein